MFNPCARGAMLKFLMKLSKSRRRARINPRYWTASAGSITLLSRILMAEFDTVRNFVIFGEFYKI